MGRKLQNQKGAAVIVVLCVLALFTAMGLSLVLASSSLAAAAQQKYKQEECYQLAKSFSAVIRDGLDASDSGSDLHVLRAEALIDDSLPAAVYRVSQSLSSTDDELHATQFLCDDPLGAEQYGSVSLLLRREDYTGDMVSAAASYDCTLYVTVRVEKNGVLCDYESVYLRLRELEERHVTGEGESAVPVSRNERNQWVTQDGSIVPGELVRTVYEDTANTAYSFWYQYGG